MTRISFVKEFENKSQFNEDGIFLITSHISFYTRGCLDEDLPGNLYILSCDMDRIYLSANPEATPESPADYIIRTWDYHICEDDPERVHMDWTFHVLKEWKNPGPTWRPIEKTKRISPKSFMKAITTGSARRPKSSAARIRPFWRRCARPAMSRPPPPPG